MKNKKILKNTILFLFVLMLFFTSFSCSKISASEAERKEFTSWIHEPPLYIECGKDYEVKVKYVSFSEDSLLFLNYNSRKDGKEFKSIELKSNGNGVYSAVIPGIDILKGTGLQYYFEEKGNNSFNNKENGFPPSTAFGQSNIYYIPVKDLSVKKYPELVITELNTQDLASNEMEYIVLKNISGEALNLKDYKMSRYYVTVGYDGDYDMPDYVLAADDSVVLWKYSKKKNAVNKKTVEDFKSYYETNIPETKIIPFTGQQFPTATGYGLTIFKDEREVSSVMWHYTDTYCTDACVKFSVPEPYTTVAEIIDNSCDNEGVNLLGVDEKTACEDASRLLSLGEDCFIMKDIELPSFGAHGTRISWKSSDEKTLSSKGKLGNYSSEKKICLTASITTGSFTTYGADLLAGIIMQGLKEIDLPVSEFIELNHEPVRKYYRTLLFNDEEVTLKSYGAEYYGSVKIKFDLGCAPSGKVTVDQIEIQSGDIVSSKGKHILRILIDENNSNEIPFSVR